MKTPYQNMIKKINEMLRRQPYEGNGWRREHTSAWTLPRSSHEWAIKGLITSLAMYADAHFSEFDTSIGEAGCLSKPWLNTVQGTRDLLKGELGRLDSQTLNLYLCEFIEMANLTQEL